MRSPLRRISAALALSAVLALVAAVALSGCAAGTPKPDATGGDANAPRGTTPDAPADTPTGELTVFAAASLTEVFDALAEEFEQQHPGTTITFDYGGSSGLVTRLTEGAAADVLTTANTATMDQAVAAGLMGAEQSVFATNALTIVTAPGNPKGITGLTDLARPGLALVVCAPQVPCGAATAQLESESGVDLAPVSEEHAVTDVLGKVASGQADAGLVYVTDAHGAAGRVDEIALPEAAGIVNEYPVGVTASAANPALAQAWIDFLLSPSAQLRLQDAGFGAAP